MYRVIDRSGKLLELEDGTPCPNGCRLYADLRFADSLSAVQKLVFADSQQCEDVDDDEAEAEDGDESEEAESEADDGNAYDASLSDGERRAILYGRGERRRLSDAEVAVQAAQRCQDAYSSFKKRIDTASGSRRPRDSRKPFEVPEHQRPQKARPGVPGGKSGPLPHGMRSRDANITDAETAYNNRNKWLENRWRDHRKGNAPANAAPTVAPPMWVR